jgi:hypothetical protein
MSVFSIEILLFLFICSLSDDDLSSGCMTANVVALLDNEIEIIAKKVAVEHFEALFLHLVGRAEEILVFRQRILSPDQYFNSKFRENWQG